MKTIPKLYSIAIAVFALVLTSCGGGASEEAATEETTAEAEEPAREYSHQTAVGIQHEVADFDAWLKVYNEKSGEAGRISVYQMNDNPNMVVLFRWTYSHEEAREDMNSEETRAVMEEAGVVGETTLTFYDLKYINEETSSMKYRVGISHEVEDYDTWKPFFDADQARRDEAGMTLRAISTDADNPNLVNLMFATDDISMVDDMMGSEDLKATMDSAGVISEPTVMVLKIPDAN